MSLIKAHGSSQVRGLLNTHTHTQKEKRANENLFFIQGRKRSPKDSSKNADMHEKEP